MVDLIFLLWTRRITDREIFGGWDGSTMGSWFASSCLSILADKSFLSYSEERTWMVTPFRSPDVAPRVVPTVVAAPNPLTVQGEGVVEGKKKALFSFAVSGWSTKQAKGKLTPFPLGPRTSCPSRLGYVLRSCRLQC